MGAMKKTRVVLDVVLTAMIVFEMFIQYTGEFLHEVIGFAFFATVVIHLALSAKWMSSTAKAAKSGKMTGRRTALAVMGILLAITIVVLGVSSVAISGLLSSAGFVWTLGSYSMWATIHAVSSYVLCALVTVHLAMHWAFLASALKVPYDPSRRRAIGTGVHVAAAMGALALGVLAVGEAMPRTANATVSRGNSGSSGGNGNAFKGPLKDRSLGSEAASSSDASSGSDSTGFSGSSGSASSSSNSSTVGSSRGDRKTRNDNGSKPRVNSSGSAQGTGSSSDSARTIEAPGSASSAEERDSFVDENGLSSGDSGSSQDSSTVEGICTLCRKRCPLSAPKCNRPYEAGLI